MPVAYLSLGSNLGDRLQNLQRGLNLLRGAGVRLQKVSSIYETYPVGETPDPLYYYNLGVKVETDFNPFYLLALLKEVERCAGRTPAGRWAPRILDIDLILYDNLTLDTPELTVPHPRMKERAFVLIPLHEIEPDLCLPDGTPIQILLTNPEIQSQEVRRLDAALSLSGVEQ